MKYWLLREEGYSTSQIRQMLSNNLESLASSGGFYTVSELSEFADLPFYTAKKYFASCYDETLIQSKIDSYCYSQTTWSTQSVLDFLNENEYFSKTGKPWSLSSFYRTQLTIPKAKKIHQRHLEIWKQFDANRENFESYNQAVKFFNQNKIYQESGKPWSRQLLSLIIQKYPELDWSLPNKKKNKLTIYSEKYHYLNSSVFQKYSSYEEMIESLDLPQDQAMISYLSHLNISKTNWIKRKQKIIENRIIEILNLKPNISYAKLWDQLTDFEEFSPEAKRKSQRMYNYMNRRQLLHLKRNTNEQTN